VPCTFVFDGKRAFYNATIRYAISDNSVNAVSTPLASIVGYAIELGKDEILLNTDGVRLDASEKDPTLVRQSAMYWLLDQLGLPNNYRRYVHYFINGTRRYTLYEDTQRPDRDMINEFYSNDANGELFKTDPFQEANGSGGFSPSASAQLPRFDYFYTTNGT